MVKAGFSASTGARVQQVAEDLGYESVTMFKKALGNSGIVMMIECCFAGRSIDHQTIGLVTGLLLSRVPAAPPEMPSASAKGTDGKVITKRAPPDAASSSRTSPP